MGRCRAPSVFLIAVAVASLPLPSSTLAFHSPAFIDTFFGRADGSKTTMTTTKLSAIVRRDEEWLLLADHQEKEEDKDVHRHLLYELGRQEMLRRQRETDDFFLHREESMAPPSVSDSNARARATSTTRTATRSTKSGRSSMRRIKLLTSKKIGKKERNVTSSSRIVSDTVHDGESKNGSGKRRRFETADTTSSSSPASSMVSNMMSNMTVNQLMDHDSKPSNGLHFAYNDTLQALKTYHDEHGDLILPRKFIVPESASNGESNRSPWLLRALYVLMNNSSSHACRCKINLSSPNTPVQITHRFGTDWTFPARCTT